MKNRLKQIKLLSVIFILTVSLCSFSVYSGADENISGSISVTITDSDKNPIENITLKLYKTADATKINNAYTFSYTDEFSNCSIPLDEITDSQNSLHISVFAKANNLPFTRMTSDKNGKISFTSLSPGAYLIVASDSNDENVIIAPFIIKLPIYDDVKMNWIFDINANPKISINTQNDTDEISYITVKKVWNGNNNHPESVKICLLCDFKESESIILSEENNWSYRWDNLSKNHSWQITEKDVPDGYNVSYDTTANTVNITNTYINKNEISSEPTTEPEEETTAKDELIYTGQLNWPVPILAIAGLLFFSIGWAILNLEKKENV